ncbi:MAG TPA: hypothetical protein VNV43_10930 [Candidatus Acidoferrales bacterium]|nr:hypothetical protein [Candidatus Acidoferrales bacterium]
MAAPFDSKASFIARKAREYGLDVIVETGTFRGEMLDRQLNNFRRLISIELNEELYQAARRRFEAYPQVQLLQGDSGVKLADAVKDLSEPALFWLDAHYSFGITAGRNTEAPIFKELSCLTGRRQGRDVILIDDARLFGFDFGYPSLRKLRQFIALRWPDYQMNVESDIICIVPANKNGKRD